MSETPGDTPETHVEESDPNADSHDGLAGDMGVSSERRGTIRGGDEQVTYAAAPVDQGTEMQDPDEAPPEQSSTDPRPEVNPSEVPRHESDPDRNPGHGI